MMIYLNIFLFCLKEELNDKNEVNSNMFLNVTEKHFILMTDRLCRYKFIGEQKSSTQIATKYMRLVAYCSSCITNNDFNLRIYCVDDLFVALQVFYIIFTCKS